MVHSEGSGGVWFVSVIVSESWYNFSSDFVIRSSLSVVKGTFDNWVKESIFMKAVNVVFFPNTSIQKAQCS